MQNRQGIMQHSSALFLAAIRVSLWATLPAVLAVCFGAAPAQQPPSTDPTLDVSLILRTRPTKDPTPEQLQQHKDRLAAAIAQLKTLEQLGDALMLGEWRLAPAEVLEIERAARDQVARQFEDEARKALRASDESRQQAVAARLVIIFVEARKSGEETGYMRKQLAALAPDVRKLIESKDRDLRQTAIAALVSMQEDTQASVDVIRHVLTAQRKSPDARDRLAVIRILQLFYIPPGLSADEETNRTRIPRIVSIGAPTLPVACLALSDADVEVRRVAAKIVLQITDDLNSHFRTQNAADRTAIVPLLDVFQKQSGALIGGIRDKDAEVRVLLLKALDQLAVFRGIVDGRDKFAPRGEEQSRELLRVALRQREPPKYTFIGDLPALRDALVSCLSDEEVDTRVYAVQVLERLEEEALPTTPALVKALRDRNPFVRWSAARALGAIEAARLRLKLPPVKGAEGAVDGLIALIYNPDPRVRVNLDTDAQIAAIVALASFDKEAEKAVDALGAVAAEDDFNARVAALSTLKSLWNQGVTKRPSIAVLARALAEQNPGHPQVQIAAAELLGLYGPAAANAVPALRGALGDPEIGVRRAVGDALLKITR